MIFNKNPFVQNLNVEYKGVKVKDVAEKILSPFGEKARKLGRAIDNATKNVTIKLDDYDD